MKRKLVSSLTFCLFFLIAIPYYSFSKDNDFQIEGIVFNDKNCNGNRNGSDSGLQGVTVTLEPGGLTDVTHNSGKYRFKNLKPKTYTVTETDPVGYCSTTPNVRVIKIKNKNVDGQHFGDSKKFVSPPGGCCHE